MGGTSPATISGTLVTSVAEVVGGIVFAQLVKPGTRVVANAFVFPRNMMTGAPFFGSVGISLHEAAINQVWRSYGIPVQSSAIGPTNSKMIDNQSCYEKAIPALVAALSGARIIQSHGVVFTQPVRPGSRVMVHDYALRINMKSGSANFGAVEAFVHQAIFNQIWRRYGVPCVAAPAGLVSSKKIDFQCGYEKALRALIAALCGHLGRDSASGIVIAHGADTPAYTAGLLFWLFLELQACHPHQPPAIPDFPGRGGYQGEHCVPAAGGNRPCQLRIFSLL